MFTEQTHAIHAVRPPTQVCPSASIGRDVQLGRGVVIGPQAVLLAREDGGEPCVLADYVRIGANATVLAGCKIGQRAQVAPGAVVTRSVPPLAIVAGNPARITGYVDSPQSPDLTQNNAPSAPILEPQTRASKVQGVTYHALKKVTDLRGSLSPGDFRRDVPFEAKRYFMVYDVPTTETRGEHAHHRCKQFLLAVSGSLQVLVDDGQQREEFTLSNPHTGLYIPPLVWGVQYRYQPQTVLLVFASEPYDSADYLRDYDEFLTVAAEARQARMLQGAALGGVQ